MSLGINLRVTGHSNQGGRKYMEDYFSVAYQASEVEKNDVEYAYFGIFDGHGGSEAAKFAKDHLLREIVNNKLFWSKYDSDVLRAIREGYISTHYAMWREQEKWPKTATGLPSTAGTTASVAFIFRKKIYIGHVGDSGIVLGYQEEGDKCWKAKPLTQDHKPECNIEKARIINSGGKVVTKSGVPRVVWNRPRVGHKGPVRRSTPFDEIPFLAVARSLGDLWSYNSALNQFIVSPDPDVRVVKIDSKSFRCLIFGTDGLWNVVTSDQAVDMARDAEVVNERLMYMGGNSSEWTNPSKFLVEKALERWSLRRMRADNTSVITVFLDQPGQPKKSISGQNNGIIDRCSNTSRYELKYEMANDFGSPEHLIYNNHYDEMNSNDMLSSMHGDGPRQNYYYDDSRYHHNGGLTSSMLDHDNSLGHSGSDRYSINSLQYSPSSNHGGGDGCNSINGFTVVEQYNTNCDTDYSYYESSMCLDNSSSNYKYDNNVMHCDGLADPDESYLLPNGSSSTILTTPAVNVNAHESSFHLANQLDEHVITTNQLQSHSHNSIDPLTLDGHHTATDIEIHNDGSNYSHSFAESYNSLLISSLENENSSSSGSSCSNSGSNCSSSSSSSSGESNGEEELYDPSHSYKSLSETGLAGHDYVFHHSPNTSNEEQQQQYQEACMLHEDGYSLTKLETRVEQRLRNSVVGLVPHSSSAANSNSNFGYSSNQHQQLQQSQSMQNSDSHAKIPQTFHTFGEVETTINNSYNQHDNVSSSFQRNMIESRRSSNSVSNNSIDKIKNVEVGEDDETSLNHLPTDHDYNEDVHHQTEETLCSIETLSSTTSTSPVLNTSNSVEYSNGTLIEMETEVLKEVEQNSAINEMLNTSDDKLVDSETTETEIETDDMDEVMAEIKNTTEYLLEESIQINEISSSNSEICSPIPSPSSLSSPCASSSPSSASSTYILEKLEIEQANLSCMESESDDEKLCENTAQPSVTVLETTSMNSIEKKLKTNNSIINKCKSSVLTRNNSIKSSLIELSISKAIFPPDKQNENENTPKKRNLNVNNNNSNSVKNSNISFISRRSLRSSNTNAIGKNALYASICINTKTNSGRKTNNTNSTINCSLSKDMKAKKILNKSKSATTATTTVSGATAVPTNCLTKSIMAKELLKIIHNGNANNNLILTKLRSRPNNNTINKSNNSNKNNNIQNSMLSQSTDNVVLPPTQKITVWSKRSRRTIHPSTSNNNNNSQFQNHNHNSNNNRSNQKLSKALCTNNVANKNTINSNTNSSTLLISSSSSGSSSSGTACRNSQYMTKFANKITHQNSAALSHLISTVSSTTSPSSSAAAAALSSCIQKSTTSAANFLATKRSSTSSRTSSAWCPSKKSVQTRNRVQKR